MTKYSSDSVWGKYAVFDSIRKIFVRHFSAKTKFQPNFLGIFYPLLYLWEGVLYVCYRLIGLRIFWASEYFPNLFEGPLTNLDRTQNDSYIIIKAHYDESQLCDASSYREF